MDIKKHIGKDLDAKIKEVTIQRRGVNSNLHKRGSMGKLSVEKGKLQIGKGSIEKYNKWLTKWINWKKAYPNYAVQIETQLNMETVINV